MNPVNGASGVSTNTTIEVASDEPIDPATLVDGSSIRLFPSGHPEVTGSLSQSADGQTVSFVPNQVLPVSVFHSLQVSGLADVSGNVISPSFSFTTGFEEDLAGPQVVGVSPPDGLLDVPTNAQIVVDFDEPVSSVGLPEALQVGASGTPIAGAQVLANGNRRVIFTPALPLVGSTLHSVTIDGVRDLAGNTMAAPVATSFTTEPGADLFNPFLSAHNPVTNATAVGTNGVVTLAFSERMNPLTVNASTFTLRENVQFTFLAGTVVMASDLLSATFTPDAPLRPFTSHTWMLSSLVTDLTVQQLTGTLSGSFTTGAGDDTTRPVVALVSPPDGTTGIPANAVVRVQFNEAVNPLTVGQEALVMQNGSPVAGLLSLNGTTLRFVPAALLLGGTTYTVAVAGVTDVVGNAVAPFASSFTTGLRDGNLAVALQTVASASSELSTSFPAVEGADGNLTTEWCTASGEAANLGAAPFVELRLPGAATVEEVRLFGRRTSSATEIFAGIVQLFAADDTELFNSSEVVFSATFPRDAVVPTGGVAGVTRVRFTLTQDESANPCLAELEVFGTFVDPTLAQVVDTQRPTVVSVTPENGAGGVAGDAAIVIAFDEPVNPATVNASTLTVRLIDISNDPPVVGQYAVTGATVTFTPTLPLPGDERVQVQVLSTVQDLAENVANSTTVTFTTAVTLDTTLPEVVMVSPADGATDVSRTTPITLTFSEPLDPATVNNTNFILTAGTSLAKSISRSTDNTVVTLSVTMPASTVITLQVTAGVTDFGGNPLTDFISSFTTSDPLDVGQPVIAAVRPGNGATRVAADTTVVLYATEALDPASVDAGLFVSADGVLAPGAIFLTAGDGTIEFVPDAPLAPNTLVQVFATPTITDLAGNALNNFASSFRIVPDSAMENAFLEDISPFSGAGAVPTNVVLAARYSEPLDPATVNATTVRVFGATELPGTRSLEDGGRVLRFVPEVPLEPNRFHSWQVSGTRGLDDVTVSFTLLASFTTGAEADTTAPVVLATSPPDGAVDIGVTTVITVEFSESVNPLSVNGTTIMLTGPVGELIPCTIRFANADQTVSITPHTPLVDESLHTIRVDGVTDVGGNPVVPATSTFETRTGP